MKRAIAVLLLSLFAVVSVQAQVTTPKDPLESDWNVSINGGFSNLGNSQTNNGFVTGTSLRVAQHWNVRADVYLLQDPQVTVALAGGEYRASLAHVFKKSAFTINAEKLEGFVNAEAGTARSSAFTGTAVSSKKEYGRFAYAVGAGFDVKLSDKMSLRPLDLKYIRSSMLGPRGVVVGNHLTFAAGLGLRF